MPKFIVHFSDRAKTVKIVEGESIGEACNSLTRKEIERIDYYETEDGEAVQAACSEEAQ